MFLKILETSQENNCVGVFLQGFKPSASLQPARKETPTQMLSCEVHKTFKNTYSEEYLLTTASGGVL